MQTSTSQDRLAQHCVPAQVRRVSPTTNVYHCPQVTSLSNFSQIDINHQNHEVSKDALPSVHNDVCFW